MNFFELSIRLIMLCITALAVIAAALCLQVIAIASDPFYGVEFTPGGRVI